MNCVSKFKLYVLKKNCSESIDIIILVSVLHPSTDTIDTQIDKPTPKNNDINNKI